MDTEENLTGKLLVAETEMDDANFTKTVVFLVHHGQDGAFGLVLNRPSTLDIGRLLRSHQGSKGSNELVYSGGPVETDRVFSLHALGSTVPPSEHAIEFADGIRFEPDFSIIDTILEAHNFAQGFVPFRFFLGYAGWTKGQLELEISQKAWFTIDASALLVFSPQKKSQWKAALRAKGGVYQVAAELGSKPSLN